jgi:phospholipase/lecithinase/hemolysin
VVANPATYSLTDATDSCYTGPYTGGGSACTGQAGYLFWDSVHPTTTGHALIAAAALNEVPEPHSWAILAGALAALTVIRKRMARR